MEATPTVEKGPPEVLSQEVSSKETLRYQRLTAAEQILQSQERIKEVWEKKVREQVSEAKYEVSSILVNSLGTFLNELSTILRQENPAPERLSESAMSKIHGKTRALFRGYSLSQLLIEFSVVREVITEELYARDALNHEVRSIIDKTIDRAITLAVMEFERIQNANMKTALTKAEASNHDLEQMAFVAAHDLNSPLATISSLLELLTENIRATASPETLEYIDYMQQTSVRMRSLVGSLLEYARLNRNKKAFQVTSLNDTVEAALQNLKHDIGKSQTKVTFEALPSVYGDLDLLSQVFQNLIANAIKFRGPQNPRIDISAQEQDQDTWLLTVKDNGIGFDNKDKNEIFSLYRRLKDKSELPGAGIGLATCRKVIELHGGKIWAESTPGQGSTFYFTLPKANSDYFH